MELDRELVLIAKMLLSEDDSEKTAEILLRRVLESTGAERGFIVLRDGPSFEQKFQIRFDRAVLSRQERDFSRSLVRQALESRELIYSPNVPEDPRFASMESVLGLGSCCVLCAPLRHGHDVFGVVYLERRGTLDSFSELSQRFLTEFAELAGLFLRRAVERQALQERNRTLERDLFSQHDFAGIVTQAPLMLELLRTVAQVADTDAPVLILGETGTGKELVARALHANSSRRAKPFVPIHCTALPGSLLESELFGHVRGAFTGADRDRAGRVATAAGGTLFLDEIAEIPLELQAKLLRFLQFGEVQRLGSDRVEKSEARILAATHQDLPRLIQAGKFRQDLYFRLNVIELVIPPLRERTGDVPLLIENFLRRYWKRRNEEPRWSTAARRCLESYSYPGNVRELEHLVERACLLARGSELGVELLPAALGAAESAPSLEPGETVEFEHYTNEELKAAKKTAESAAERRFLQGLMKRCDGNVSRAARESGLPRSYLQRLLGRHPAEETRPGQ